MMDAILVLGLVALGQLGIQGVLVYWMLRSDGRLRPVSVEKAEAEARRTKAKPGGKPYGGLP